MKTAAALSLTVNLLLSGFVIWLACAAPRPERHGVFSRSLTHRVPRVKHQPAPPPRSDPLPEVVEVNEPFHWAQIESADYRVYLANLRDIACPESTVRDILIADVNDLFRGRVKALVDEVNGQFWNVITRKDDFEKLVEGKAKQLSALDHERDEIFAALFGNSNPRAEQEERAAIVAQRNHWERLADFLPAEKRAQLAAAKGELERAWRDVCRTPDLTGVTQRLELPDATAAEAYDIRRQAEDAARQLGDNKSLSAEDRQARLQAVGAETKQSLSAALGPKGFAAYEKMDGGWMQHLSAPRP